MNEPFTVFSYVYRSPSVRDGLKTASREMGKSLQEVRSLFCRLPGFVQTAYKNRDAWTLADTAYYFHSQGVSKAELAALFNYSDSHISRMIRTSEAYTVRQRVKSLSFYTHYLATFFDNPVKALQLLKESKFSSAKARCLVMQCRTRMVAELEKKLEECQKPVRLTEEEILEKQDARPQVEQSASPESPAAQSLESVVDLEWVREIVQENAALKRQLQALRKVNLVYLAALQRTLKRKAV